MLNTGALGAIQLRNTWNIESNVTAFYWSYILCTTYVNFKDIRGKDEVDVKVGESLPGTLYLHDIYTYIILHTYVQCYTRRNFKF